MPMFSTANMFVCITRRLSSRHPCLHRLLARLVWICLPLSLVDLPQNLENVREIPVESFSIEREHEELSGFVGSENLNHFSVSSHTAGLAISNLPRGFSRVASGVAIGRRNYLFAGADTGGERVAAIYSLVGSAKLNGIDPEAYLRYVLARIADNAINRID